MLDNIVYIRNREWEDILLLEKENEKRKISEKKSELLRILQKKEELRITGKNTEWVRKNQQLWRKYRDSTGLNSDDEEDLRREIVN